MVPDLAREVEVIPDLSWTSARYQSPGHTQRADAFMPGEPLLSQPRPAKLQNELLNLKLSAPPRRRRHSAESIPYPHQLPTAQGTMGFTAR